MVLEKAHLSAWKDEAICTNLGLMNWLHLRRFLPAVLILGGLGGCSAWVIYPIFEHAQVNAQRSTCQSNLKVIALACELYASDNGDKFPPLSHSGKGWAEILSASYKAETPTHFSCPAGEESAVPSSDYFYNARLAKMSEAKMKEPMSTISFGDGVDNGPTNSHLAEAPIYVEDEDLFAVRHFRGANYAFADGHVKWLPTKSVNQIFSFDPSKKANWP